MTRVELLMDLKLHQLDLKRLNLPTKVHGAMLDRLVRSVEGPIQTVYKGVNYTRKQSLELFASSLKEFGNA